MLECAPWLSVCLYKQPEDTIGQIWAKRMRFRAAVFKMFRESLAPYVQLVYFINDIILNKLILACENNVEVGLHYLSQ